jgi:hypothetical protein
MTYEGWTNRETWAVALHVSNDQGWHDMVLESITEAMVGAGEDAADNNKLGFLSAHEAGGIVRESVETLEDALETGDCDVSAVYGVLRDIGSLWRVDWSEIGASFLDALKDQS